MEEIPKDICTCILGREASIVPITVFFLKRRPRSETTNWCGMRVLTSFRASLEMSGPVRMSSPLIIAAT